MFERRKYAVEQYGGFLFKFENALCANLRKEQPEIGHIPYTMLQYFCVEEIV